MATALPEIVHFLNYSFQDGNNPCKSLSALSARLSPEDQAYVQEYALDSEESLDMLGKACLMLPQVDRRPEQSWGIDAIGMMLRVVIEMRYGKDASLQEMAEGPRDLQVQRVGQRTRVCVLPTGLSRVVRLTTGCALL